MKFRVHFVRFPVVFSTQNAPNRSEKKMKCKRLDRGHRNWVRIIFCVDTLYIVRVSLQYLLCNNLS